MTLTKKNYKEIAEIFREHYKASDWKRKAYLESVIEDLGDYFKKEFSNFDIDKFNKAIISGD